MAYVNAACLKPPFDVQVMLDNEVALEMAWSLSDFSSSLWPSESTIRWLEVDRKWSLSLLWEIDAQGHSDGHFVVWILPVGHVFAGPYCRDLHPWDPICCILHRHSCIIVYFMVECIIVPWIYSLTLVNVVIIYEVSLLCSLSQYVIGTFNAE